MNKTITTHQLYSSLTKQEYKDLLKEWGMCTKKWTKHKIKSFQKAKANLLKEKENKKKQRRIFK